jgi:predicted DNA-binding antitoxin AbrB/MazE fold protein
MAITVDAVYVNGVLKPSGPLPLTEHQKVRVTIQPASNWVQETAGILGWTGSAELAERFALDVDLEYPPNPEEA